MAKSKSFFGLRRGSTKSHTFQVVYGQQITKDRVSSVHNPQTPRQNAQRIVFATVSQAMKFMGPIINHSFEGVPYGGKSLNRFAKLNLERLRAYSALDYENSASYADARCFMTTKNISALIPNRYIMAQGSLVLDPKSANKILEGGVFPFDTDNSIQDSAAGVTLGQVLKALFGFTRPGQQLTKCFIICRSGQGYNLYEYGGVPTVPGTVISSSKFLSARLVLKDNIPWDEDQHATWASLKNTVQSCFDTDKSDSALLAAIFNGMVSHENAYYLDDLTSIETIFNLEGFVAAETTILSEPYGSNWLRSNAEMTLTAVPDPDNNYGLTWYEANRAWAEGPSQNADAQRYLNEGGDENQIGY